MQNLVITAAGEELVSKLIAGTTAATFAAIQTSSHDYSAAAIEGLASLEDVRQTEPVSSVAIKNDTYVEITARIDNSSVTSGYSIRCIGLFAEDGDGNSILFGVSLCDEDTPDYMPAFEGLTVTGISYKFIVKVDNADNVEVTVDPAAVPTVTQVEDLESTVEEIIAAIEFTVEDETLYIPGTFHSASDEDVEEVLDEVFSK